MRKSARIDSYSWTETCSENSPPADDGGVARDECFDVDEAGEDFDDFDDFDDEVEGGLDVERPLPNSLCR